MTNYSFEINDEIVKADINRLTNQLWKLIPMKEKEEAWDIQLDTVLLEIVGLNKIFSFDKNYLVLLSKLEGLREAEIEFFVYRKTVFEAISLLRELKQNEL